MPFHDLFASNFVLVQPSNLIVYLVWMGRVESDVIKDQEDEDYRKVHVQWWVFVRKGAKMMRNYIIIVGSISGSVIMQTQNNGLKFPLSHFVFGLKAIT